MSIEGWSLVPIIRRNQLENLEQLTSEELAEFLAELPAGQESLELLFDYIDDVLDVKECDHTLGVTMQYVMFNGLDFAKITSWLQSNGGYCDCEVLVRIVPAWNKFFNPEPSE
jgi:hypothetical protein